MAVTAQLSPKIALGGFVWSTFASAAEWGIDVATQDVTTFEYAPFTASVPGMKTLQANVTAFQDFASGSLSEWLRSNVGAAQVATIAPVGDTAGNQAVITNGNVLPSTRYLNATVGAVPTTVANLQGGVIAEGLVTQSSASTISATGHTTAVQVGALTTGHTIYAAIHVLSVAGTSTPTATFQLESASTSGGSYTLRGSAGAGLTAVGGQWLSSTATTTDTWWKLAVTLSGTSPVFGVLASIAIV